MTLASCDSTWYEALGKYMFRKILFVLLWIAAFSLIALGAWLAFGDKVSASATCFTVAILLLLIAHIDQLESFKGFGIEAKTRELKETLSQAGAMNDQIKTLTENLQSHKTEADKINAELRGTLARVKDDADRAKRIARRAQF